MKRALLLFFFISSLCHADDGLTLSGLLSEEGGFSQLNSTSFDSYEYSRLLLKGREDLSPELSLGVDGEADRQSFNQQAVPHWLTNGPINYVNLESNSQNTNTNGLYDVARLDRAFLKWASGRLELTAGLQSFDNGSTNFYSPTHYFNPLPPLAWTSDESLGSEGVNANCFLFDDLSLEGSTRWLAGGTNEWVVRLMDRGIGLTATPSFAHMTGRDGVGAQLSGTFPDFQVRWEGVEWFQNGANQLEWVGALSTLFEGTQWTLQALQDSTGEALGPGANGSAGAFTLFASAQKTFTAQWKTQMALMKSPKGGPWLFWPRIDWTFEPHWILAFQGQWFTANNGGPLVGLPSQEGLSLAYTF